MAKPKAPKGATAVYRSASHSVLVSWQAVAGATSYKVQRWVGLTMLYDDLVTTSALYVLDTSLTDAETYAYRIQALNADGGSSYSVPTAKVTIIDAPTAVTDVTAQWNTNGSRTLGWTNNPTTLAPYLYHYVFCRDSKSNTWGQINRIAGTNASYLDSRSLPDRKLDYRIWTANAAGGAYYMSAIATTYSAPTAPANVRASWSGVDIVVQWDAPSTIASQYRVEHLAEGGAWETVATLGRVKSWRHAAPERGVRHMYRVTALAPVPSLGTRAYSTTTTGPWLAAQTNPSPPTDLGPAYAPAGEAWPVTYRHNPLSPDSPEGGVQSRYRRGTGEWTTVAGATIPSQTVGVTEVQVATRTSTSGWSDWSASLMVTVRARPALSITSPASGAVLPGPLLALAWSGPASQIQWEAMVYDGPSLVTRAVGTTERSTALTLADNTTYMAYVRAHDGYLWSQLASVSLSTLFITPEVPSVTLTPDPGSLTMVADAATPAGAVRVELMRRRTGPGWETDPWVSVGDLVGGRLVDLLPPLCDLEYATVAWTAAGASSTSAPVPASVGVSAIAINYGPSYGAVAWMSLGLPTRIPRSEERDTALHEFAGRTRPVEALGDMTRVKIAASGVVVDEIGTHADGWRAALAADQRWLRDPTGESWRCSIAGMQLDIGAAVTQVSFAAEEVAA